MMWNEFEEIAGYRVRFETYKNIIEPMYLAIPQTISKVEFVKMLDRKRFEYIPEKSQEQIKIEKKLRAEINGYIDEISYLESRIGDYNRMLDDETDARWIKEYKSLIKINRNRIK